MFYLYNATDCDGKSAESFVQTSDNVIVEAIRREGNEIELRLSECLGKSGNAKVTITLPHISDTLTDLLGGDPQPLAGKGSYTFAVRPQQIVAIRFKTESKEVEIKRL